MDSLRNDYLNKIDKYLRPLPASERADIINEIKSQMRELEAEKRLSPDQIIQRLGNPKELAGAYLGQSLSQSSSFSFRRLGQAILFYSLAGLGGIFLLPFTTILAGALLVCGVIAPVSGLIQAVGFLLGFDVPWVSFQFGSWTAHPLLALPLSILFGILFMLAGKGLWKITLKYIQVVSRQKNSVITGYN